MASFSIPCCSPDRSRWLPTYCTAWLISPSGTWTFTCSSTPPTLQSTHEILRCAFPKLKLAGTCLHTHTHAEPGHPRTSSQPPLFKSIFSSSLSPSHFLRWRWGAGASASSSRPPPMSSPLHIHLMRQICVKFKAAKKRRRRPCPHRLKTFSSLGFWFLLFLSSIFHFSDSASWQLLSPSPSSFASSHSQQTFYHPSNNQKADKCSSLLCLGDIKNVGDI